MYDLIADAFIFASRAHAGQVRKYNGDPYITHPFAVAEIVRTVEHTDAMIAAAYLHDVVEDCGVTHDIIRDKFGSAVGDYVYYLSKISKSEDGNRQTRKAIDRLHYSNAPEAAQTIKTADIIHNSSCIRTENPDFAPQYLAEQRLLLRVMDKGNIILYEIAWEICQ